MNACIFPLPDVNIGATINLFNTLGKTPSVRQIGETDIGKRRDDNISNSL